MVANATALPRMTQPSVARREPRKVLAGISAAMNSAAQWGVVYAIGLRNHGPLLPFQTAVFSGGH